MKFFVDMVQKSDKSFKRKKGPFFIFLFNYGLALRGGYAAPQTPHISAFLSIMMLYCFDKKIII
jgi:hypothetical protein